MSNQTDPLAGIATSNAAPAKPKRLAKPPVAPAASTGVIVLDERRARRQAYKAARDTARAATGYDNSSPIWGKQMGEVLSTIEALIEGAQSQMAVGDYGVAQASLESALNTNRELQKRIATNKLTSTQLRP